MCKRAFAGKSYASKWLNGRQKLFALWTPSRSVAFDNNAARHRNQKRVLPVQRACRQAGRQATVIAFASQHTIEKDKCWLLPLHIHCVLNDLIVKWNFGRCFVDAFAVFSHLSNTAVCCLPIGLFFSRCLNVAGAADQSIETRETSASAVNSAKRYLAHHYYFTCANR